MRFRDWFSDEGELLFACGDEVDYLGCGAFGSAYRIREDGTVLKVSRHNCGTSYVIEVCYLLRRNGHQVPPYLPEVYAFERDEQNGIWFAQMEFVHVAGGRDHAPEHVRNFLERLLPEHWAGDYHPGNWGTRESGEVVLFDPSGAVSDECLHAKALELLEHVRSGGSMGMFLPTYLQTEVEHFRAARKSSKYIEWDEDDGPFWDFVMAYPRRIAGKPRTPPGFKEKALRDASYSWKRAYYRARAKRLMSPKQFREFAAELQTRRKQCEKGSQPTSFSQSCSQRPADPQRMRELELKEALQP